jgi:putative ubiquitin-RnfH superfamily antitoxin RatB of RatAB toxin-antitoxin module
MARRLAELQIEIVYAMPQHERSVRLSMPRGATVRDALEKSGLLPLARGRVGIFGKVVEEDAQLTDGDRVEIYRPLAADPKEARRRRARGR